MANMGSTGTINITKDMMVKAEAAVDNYQSTIKSLNAELKTEIDGLIPSSFSGSAATGFKNFYDSKIEPNTGTNLKQMLESLKTVCETIKSQIPGETKGVDDQLGEGNRGAGDAKEKN